MRTAAAAGDRLPQKGRLLGLESLGANSHRSDALALGDSTSLRYLVPEPDAHDEAIHGADAAFSPAGRRRTRPPTTSMLMMGTAKNATALAARCSTGRWWRGRLAARRYGTLRMSRDDIASYLGLALESVSGNCRSSCGGLLAVHNRRIGLAGTDQPARAGELPWPGSRPRRTWR